MPVLKPESRYSNRLNRVLNFASANSHQNLQLDTLAEMACMSKYHFTRVFHDQLGESPIRFLKRTRLERAGVLLKNKHLTISQVAINSGFSSIQSFSREFGKKFDSGPRHFRLNYISNVEDKDNNGIGYLNSEFEGFRAIGIQYDLSASAEKIQVVKKLPTKVAYIRSIGWGGCNEIYKAMQAIKIWAQEAELWTDETEIIGSGWDYSSMTPETMYRFDSCVPIPDHFSSQAGVSVRTIPGGLYAVAQIPYRSAKDITLIWRWFSLTLRNASKFKNYTARLYTGPWYQVYKSEHCSGKPVIELYAYLCYNNVKFNYIQRL